MKYIGIGLTLLVLALGLGSCTNSVTTTAAGLEMSGRWDYAFFKGYESIPDKEFYSDPYMGFSDATTVNTVQVNGQNLMVLSFPPRSSGYNSVVVIFGTEDPLSPRFLAAVSPDIQDKIGFIIESIAIEKNIVYAGLFGDRGLWRLDISEPSRPKDLGIARLAMDRDVTVSANHVFGVGVDGISIGEVSGSKEPGEMARIKGISRECCITVKDDLLFVGIGKTLSIYDILDPISPVIRGICELSLSGNLTTDLPFPQPGSVHWAKWASLLDLEAAGNYVYAAFGAGGLRIIDVSSPAHPVEVSQVDLGGFAMSLSVKGNYVYINHADSKVKVLRMSNVDISRLEKPVIQNTIVTESVFGFGGATSAYCWIKPQILDGYVYIPGLNYMDIVH